MTGRIVFLVALTTALMGCGGAPPSGESHVTGFTAKNKLEELSEGWFLAQLTLNRPPAKLEDLNPRGAGFAVQALKNGEIIAIWGATLDLKGTTAIVAYEKDAPTLGGWALMQNGKVKQFSAAEFTAAPKAGKP